MTASAPELTHNIKKSRTLSEDRLCHLNSVWNMKEMINILILFTTRIYQEATAIRLLYN